MASDRQPTIRKKTLHTRMMKTISKVVPFRNALKREGMLGGWFLYLKVDLSRFFSNMSYADLITQAIMSTPDQRLTLSQIYEWMCDVRLIFEITFFLEK